ncbi:thioesterase II family protein [Rhodococcoides fascians]|uniref:thioesterase II family protein n=1 Tax=Rhodococcoides fascians TaxID=1828 RepID=UPI003CECE949
MARGLHGSTSTTSRWFRRQLARPVEVTQRIVCFPHAGGTAHAYSSWTDKFPSSVEVVAVQYPGRQDRLSEPCIEDMGDLVAAIVAEMPALAELPLTLFGHSMGSAVAYEVARALESSDAYLVDTVFVSGRPAPSALLSETKHLLTDTELVEAMRTLSDVDDAVYDLPKLWPLILPPLRSDLRLLDGHRPTELSPLNAPIVAMGGKADVTCSIAELDSWSRATRHPLVVHGFEGGHHYPRLSEDELIATITKSMTIV